MSCFHISFEYFFPIWPFKLIVFVRVQTLMPKISLYQYKGFSHFVQPPGVQQGKLCEHFSGIIG